jgi:hypothetical protein
LATYLQERREEIIPRFLIQTDEFTMAIDLRFNSLIILEKQEFMSGNPVADPDYTCVERASHQPLTISYPKLLCYLTSISALSNTGYWASEV